MRTIALISLCTLLFAIGAAVAATPEYAPGRMILQLEDGVKPTVDKSGDALRSGVADLDRVLALAGATALDQLYVGVEDPVKSGTDLRQFYTVLFPDHLDLDDMEARFSALPSVREVWKDAILHQDALPNDISPSQWYLRNMNLGGTDIRWVGGWAETQGDSNIVIAVCDSGVDWHHPDLGGTHPDKVTGAIYTNWVEYYGTPGADDDFNGKTDDIRGWDFVNSPGQGWPGEDDSTPDNDPMDFNDHGTNCAGIIAGIANNGVGLAGAASGCKIMPIRVGFLNSAGEGVAYASTMSSGMIYAAQNGANIINHSYGSSSFLNFAMTVCADNDVLVFNSAGNDNDNVPDYLGTHPGAISVAATADGDVKADFSDYGNWVEVSAPGVAMYTTSYDPGSGTHGYTSVQGTSFSTPLAAGAAALIWSSDIGMSDAQVESILLGTCDDIDAVNPGYEGLLGAGRINLLKALGDNFQEVPGEFEELYDAMNTCAPGDTIAVLATESLPAPVVVAAKELFLLGGYDATYTTRDPVGSPTLIAGTIVNTALQPQGGATSTTVIDGFTCSGGGGRSFTGIPDSGDFGGGVVLNGSSPTLRNIVVTGNTAGSSSTNGGGGGVLMLNSDAVLDNVHVHGNSSILGAGLYVSGGAPQLIDCVIENNTPITDNPLAMPYGGGMYVVDSDVTMTNCTIDGHLEVESGGGIYAKVDAGAVSLDLTDVTVTGNSAKVKGGGIYMANGTFAMNGGEVSGNANTAGATFMSGGGLCLDASAVIIAGVTVDGNAAQVGGGITVDSATSLSMTDNVFTTNTGLYFGGGVYLLNTTGAVVSGNTIAANHSPTSSAGLYLANSNGAVDNNLVAFNTGAASDTANGINAVNGTPTFSCNDVFGNDADQYGGVGDPTGTDGNVSVDPLFCDMGAGDFTLTDTSPCLAANSGGCGQIGALGQGCTSGTGIDDEVPTKPLAFRVDPNYPNPFNPATTIRFALPQAGHVSVKIFDVSGRLVRTLVDEVREAAEHDVMWIGDDDRGRAVASGVYFFRVSTEQNLHVSRMALVK